MVNFEINDKQYSAPDGTLIIQVADREHIAIPRFCYHPKLSIVASCRMCLVEVAKSPKPLPACATPVAEGMKIWTHSPCACDAQKSVMEFLLINHPLDCPICDQGGECELQDQALEYGKDVSRFTEGKRSVKDLDIGPLIKTDMTRCIHCTRCVRFGTEIAGMRELGATGRGEHMEIGTFLEQTVDSEVSGNVIDLCPVGALTSKPFHHKGRAWELQQVASIAPHDCVGSHVYVHTLRGEVMRVVPRQEDSINEVWISDRDRFSYSGLKSPDRLLKPLIKKNNEWVETDWDLALQFTIKSLQAILEKEGGRSVGALVSPSATLEECYLAQKWLRGMGISSIDHRLHRMDFSCDSGGPSPCPTFGLALTELENADTILLIGSHPRTEQPLINHRLAKAARKGAQIIMVNPIQYDFNFKVAAELTPSGGQLLHPLLGIMNALLSQKNERPHFAWLTPFLKNTVSTPEEKQVAEWLGRGNKKVAIFLGLQAQAHWHASALQLVAEALALFCQASLGYLTEGANSVGAWVSGVLPDQGPGGISLSEGKGLNAHSMVKTPLPAYVLFGGVEPEFDLANTVAARRALSESAFVVAFSPFRGGMCEQYAKVMLPIAAYTETEGTFINGEGRWQSFNAANPPPGEARPGWEVLRALTALCGGPGSLYSRSEEVRDELKHIVQNVPSVTLPSLEQRFRRIEPILSESKEGLRVVTEWPIYRVDSLVRRSKPLQDTAASPLFRARLNPKTASLYSIKGENKMRIRREGEFECILPVAVDKKIPENTVHIASALEGGGNMGQQGAVQVFLESNKDA